MDTIKFGRTGLEVSRICRGCMTYGEPERGGHAWTLPEDDSRPFIRKALDLGINFFDTANVYSDGSSEEIVGRALKDFAPRDEVVIATKVARPHAPRTERRRPVAQGDPGEIDASLQRLGTDYVDLYQIHRWDYDTPIEETLEALHDVVRAGKARYIGASSMYAWQFAKALATCRAARLGALRLDAELRQPALPRGGARDAAAVPGGRDRASIPWSPLARGRLTRDWDARSARAETDEFGKTLYAKTADADGKVVEAVAKVAAARGIPRAQVALAWVLQKPGITAPIVGATKLSHLDDAVAALSVRLTDEEIAQLEAPYVAHEIVGFS